MDRGQAFTAAAAQAEPTAQALDTELLIMWKSERPVLRSATVVFLGPAVPAAYLLNPKSHTQHNDALPHSLRYSPNIHKHTGDFSPSFQT